jgi:lipid A 3-O-deacylase
MVFFLSRLKLAWSVRRHDIEAHITRTRPRRIFVRRWRALKVEASLEHVRSTLAAIAAALLGAVLAPAALAQSFDSSRDCGASPNGVAGRRHLVSFQLENDLFAGTDSQYTSGVKLTWVSPNLASDFNDPLLPSWVRCSTQRLRHVLEWFLPPEASARNVVVTVGQAMYTPADRDRTTQDPADRPYAGWAYLGFGYNVRRDPSAGDRGYAPAMPTLDTVEIDLGLVGPHAYARQSQDFVHRVRGLPRFQGWSNQLRDEFGIQIVSERKYRPPSWPRGDWQAQVIPHWGFSVGNVASYVNVGAEFRAGWRLPDDFGTSPIRPGGDNAAPRAGGPSVRVYQRHSFHAFVSIDGRAVANNIFLDGNTFAESHAVKKRPFVGDIAYGWAYTWPPTALFPSGKLAYSHYVQSREFYGEARNHGFGSVTLSVEF